MALREEELGQKYLAGSMSMQSILPYIFIGCKDIANRKTCQKWLRNGKCSKDWTIKKCPKTCGNCSDDACEDKMQSKKCQKLKNKGNLLALESVHFHPPWRPIWHQALIHIYKY